MHPYKRSQRVAEVIRRIVAEQVLLGLKIPGTELITVTEVEMTPDLRIARVFISYLGDAGERDRMIKNLQNAEYRIKKAIGSQLRLKYTPQLQFRYDDTYEKGNRIDELLDGLKDGDEGTG